MLACTEMKSTPIENPQGIYIHVPAARQIRALCMPDIEKIRKMFFDVTAAQKVLPAATATASSPCGSPSVQSLPGAQLSKGLNASMDGASELDWLAYSAPCNTAQHY